jgi:nucleotide-binding universal stress UspA family protein
MSSHLPLNRILVPLDFYEESLRSLRVALEMARLNDAKVVLLNVVDQGLTPILHAFDRPEEDFYKSMRDKALESMEESLEEADRPYIAERLVVQGKPREEIVEVAKDQSIDLIVMARRSTTKLRYAILGSVTESVLRETACAVLVLPAPEVD